MEVSLYVVGMYLTFFNQTHNINQRNFIGVIISIDQLPVLILIFLEYKVKRGLIN